MAKRDTRSPRVAFRAAEPLQDYYNDGKGCWYSVAKLLDETKDLPVFDMPLAGIDLDQTIWQGCDMLGLARHVKQCMDADLECPIGDAIEALEFAFCILEALAVCGALAGQLADLGEGLGAIEGDLSAVVLDVHGSAVLQNNRAVGIEFQFHGGGTSFLLRS